MSDPAAPASSAKSEKAGKNSGNSENLAKAAVEEEVQALRQALQRALLIVRPKGFVQIVKEAGFEITSAASTLTKFANSETGAGLKLEKDRSELKKFLFETEMGRSLLGETHRGFVCDLVRRSARPTMGPDYADPVGLYWFLHGSYIFPQQFVVRLLRVSANVHGYLHTEEIFFANKTANAGVRRVEGIFIYTGGYPQIVSLYDDNAKGAVTFSSEDVLVAEGKIRRMVGTISGMTKNRMTFHRAALIDRIATVKGLDELAKETGIRPFDEWSPAVQAQLGELALAKTEQLFSDPIGELCENKAREKSGR